MSGLEVSEWCEPVVPPGTSTSPLKYSIAPAVLGVSATLALHGLLLEYSGEDDRSFWLNVTDYFG